MLFLIMGMIGVILFTENGRIVGSGVLSITLKCISAVLSNSLFYLLVAILFKFSGG